MTDEVDRSKEYYSDGGWKIMTEQKEKKVDLSVFSEEQKDWVVDRYNSLQESYNKRVDDLLTELMKRAEGKKNMEYEFNRSTDSYEETGVEYIYIEDLKQIIEELRKENNG